MNIEIVGQVISSTNYATDKIFYFSPENIRNAALNFGAAGVDTLEIPENVADPDGKTSDGGVDEEAVAQTVNMLPEGTVVLGTYIGGGVGADNDAYLKQKKNRLAGLLQVFPSMRYAMLHPPGANCEAPAEEIVDVWKQLADHAVSLQPGFELCLHNHYDSACESAEQVRAFLDALRKLNHPALRWGPDTGHCHGMGDAYLEVFADNADLIGDYFHIKARVAAFDKLHGGDKYRQDRDIWGGEAEIGRGLYSGFVNVADPEIETPFTDVFSMIREARADRETVYGAMEIDVPRQHPILEAMCGVFYLTRAHGLTTGRNLSCDQIVANVFGAA